jgi:small conductance mechanosensitive channel
MLPLAAAAIARLIPTTAVGAAPGGPAGGAPVMTEEMAQSMRDAVQQFAEAAQSAADVAKAAATQAAPPPPPPEDPGFHISDLDAQTVLTLTETYGLPVIKALIILVIAFMLASWARRVVLKGLTRAKMDITLAKFISNAAKLAILVLSLLMILSIFGIQTASFAVVIGALGLAIGLAFQGSLSNVASGMMLLIFRPFKVGDVVNLVGTVCKVDEIQLFFTTVDTFDNRRLIIPNSKIFGETIENITYHPKRRADVVVGVAYDADIDKTRAAFERAVERVTKKIEGEAHQIWLDSLGDSAVVWHLRVWCKTDDWGDCKQEVIKEAKNSLDEAGIGIPFPQMDVHFFRPKKGE